MLFTWSTCRKWGLASASPDAMLSDKYIDGLRKCCWINKKNRIVMTGRGTMATEAMNVSFKLRTPVINNWNTISPAMILKNNNNNSGEQGIAGYALRIIHRGQTSRAVFRFISSQWSGKMSKNIYNSCWVHRASRGFLSCRFYFLVFSWLSCLYRYHEKTSK